MKDIKSRKYFIRVCQENHTVEDGIVTYNFNEIYEKLCSKYDKVMYIIHDKDPKNIHAHFIVQNHAQIRKSTLINLIKYCDIQKQRGSNLQCYEYLQHKGIENKEPYDKMNIKCNFPNELEIWLKEINESESNYQKMINALYSGSTPEEIMINYPKEYFTHRNKIHTIYSDLNLKKATESWRDIQVFYIWGDSRTGKTRSVIEYCKNNNIPYYRVTEYEKDPFQNYTCEPCLILDEYRENFPVSSLLTYLDGYEKTFLSSRYSNKYALYNTVFIISNIPLSQQYTHCDEKTRMAIKNRIKYELKYTETEIVILEKNVVIKIIPNPYYSNKLGKENINEK